MIPADPIKQLRSPYPPDAVARRADPPTNAVALHPSSHFAPSAGAPILPHRLRAFAQFDLSDESHDAMHVLTAEGRSLQVLVPARWITLWMPLSGTLDMTVPDCRWRVPAGAALAWRERALRVDAHRPAWWIAVCGSPQAWAPYLRPHGDDCEATPFPHQDACSRTLHRLAVRTARMARRTDAGALAESALAALGEELLDWQRTLRDLLPRCNGRTLYRRRQTLMRLLWVRHLIEHREEARLDLATLAASASYSACHLIRSYRDVFGETPSEHVTRLRSERALKLVLETSMPVCEITEALGFESQSAFCRAFKNLYGMTTSQARHRLNDDLGASQAA